MRRTVKEARCLTHIAHTCLQISTGLVPDGGHFVARARDEAADWRAQFKAPIPTSVLAARLGSYVQAYTLYSSVRPFGVTSIVAGWDSEADVAVDGEVGVGPSRGGGGRATDAPRGGPGLYMIEPSGLYWVRIASSPPASLSTLRLLPPSRSSNFF